MLPRVGFLPPSDPRVRSTIEAIERELMQDGFVLRYRVDEENVDGLPGREGAFVPCSFWLANAFYLIGRKADAKKMFERLLRLQNDLGLLSEEYDPIAKRQLGNFPQAFTHLALVNSARIIGGDAKITSEDSTG
jgi:GH15 family glucan-1,4-alpha-glucosidase